MLTTKSNHWLAGRANNTIVAVAALAICCSDTTSAQSNTAMRNYDSVSCHTVDVDGINIFYREAGNPDKPTILLLHGFCSSSHMFRDLIPRLSPDFHLIAPDYPGFGNSDAPSEGKLKPTFANWANLMSDFVQRVRLKHFIIYMQDFGGPVGFRMAVMHPDWIDGLIIQNANAYLDGLSEDSRNNINALAGEPTPDKLKAAEPVESLDFIKMMYQQGARNPNNMNPDAWNMDIYFTLNPENRRIQKSLIINYSSNLAEYPKWQQFLHTQQPPTLIVWGEGDGIFIKPGAEAYKRDVPKAEIHYFNTSHFALEEDSSAIAGQIKAFFH